MAGNVPDWLRGNHKKSGTAKVSHGVQSRPIFHSEHTDSPIVKEIHMHTEAAFLADGGDPSEAELKQMGLDASNKEYAQLTATDPDVACVLTADLERGRDVVPQSECLRRHQALQDKLNPSSRIFRPIVKGLLTVGDIAAEELSKTPGVGAVAAEAYKAFRPRGPLAGSGTHRENVIRNFKLADKPHSIAELAKATRVPRRILQEVFNRGVGAHSSSPKSVRLKHSFVKNVDAPMSAKLSAEQWGMARVYSFLDGNPKHDEDLRTNLEGRGLFDNFLRSGVGVAKKVVGRVKDVFRGVRLDYSPSVRSTLRSVGGLPVVQMFVRRDPIRAPLNLVLNALTLGKWEEAKKKYSYDKLFHLGLECVVKIGSGREVRRYVLEKNEVINISPAKAMDALTETLEVPMGDSTTMNALLETGKEVLGPNFFKYDAFTNNCQDFILAILQQYMTPELRDWIKQPVEQLLPELPGYTKTLAKLATDAGAIFNVALEGRGGLRPNAAFAAQLKRLGVKPEDYLHEAQRKAHEAGLAWRHLGFSSRPDKKLAIPNADGVVVNFGAVDYGDHILYTLSGDLEAEKHRKSYLARATKIRGDWKKDPYSPNSLAIEVLW